MIDLVHILCAIFLDSFFSHLLYIIRLIHQRDVSATFERQHTFNLLANSLCTGIDVDINAAVVVTVAALNLAQTSRFWCYLYTEFIALAIAA